MITCFGELNPFTLMTEEDVANFEQTMLPFSKAEREGTIKYPTPEAMHKAFETVNNHMEDFITDNPKNR